MDSRRIRGLRNPGSLCYFNAAVQMLAHLGIFEVHVILYAPDNPVAAELRDVLDQLRTGSGGPVDPAKLVAAVAARTHTIDVSEQNDAHELFQVLIALIAQPSIGDMPKEVNEETEEPRARMARSWRRTFAAFREDPDVGMARLFYGQTMVGLQCLRCSHCIVQGDVFSHLSLVPGREDGGPAALIRDLRDLRDEFMI
jgi:ubiquitin C-terminal hydrolase